MSSQDTAAVAARIMALTWEQRFDQMPSRVKVLKEYMRRAALVVGGRQVAGWPFFDIAAVVDPAVRADPELAERVHAHVRAAPGVPDTVAKTCVWALHWAELVSVRSEEFAGVADPFEALIAFYARGGAFTFDEVGWIQVDLARFPPGTPAVYTPGRPEVSLDPAVLDEIDRAAEEQLAERRRSAAAKPSFSRGDGRLLVRLSGRLDEDRLGGFATALGLTRRGRLGDREDAEFGSRVLAEGRAELGLWRRAEESWSVTLDYKPDAAGLADEVTDLVERAAPAAGLSVESRKDLPPKGSPA